MVKELITLESEYVQNCGKCFTGVTGRKRSLQNDWLIFREGVWGRYLFVQREYFLSAVLANFNFRLEGTLSRVTPQQRFGRFQSNLARC